MSNGDSSVLTDFVPGYLQKSTRDLPSGMLSHATQMSKTLDIPSDIRVCIASDSTLTLYPTDRGATQRMALKGTTHITRYSKAKHPKYVANMRIWNGGTMSDITDSLP